MGPESVEGGSQNVETFLSLKLANDSSSSYKIRMFICNTHSKSNFILLGDTESQTTAEGLTLVFNISFVFEYFFEKEQTLKIVILENESSTAAVIMTTVGKVMGSRGSSITLPVTNNSNTYLGELTIDCKNAAKCVVELKFNVSSRFFNAPCSDPYLELYYVLCNHNDGKNWRKVYKSSEQSGPATNMITFNQMRLMMDEVCGGDYERPILFEFHDTSNGPAGYSKFTLNQLKFKNTQPIFKSLDEGSPIIGEAIIDIHEQQVYKFIDYLKMGMQINLVVGVDFTCSNGNPEDPNSLHYAKGVQPNPYERAIRSCGTIVAYYDYDQKFPVYGFGGKPPGETKVNHCFNLNLSNNPYVEGVDNIINAYKNSLFLVRLDGPTFFAPLITTVLNEIKREMQNGEQIYYVLMILTDGMINDMDATCDVLVECATYPLSVIIIGIGNADFTNMNILGKYKQSVYFYY